MRCLVVISLALVSLAFSQTWLDPDSFPNADGSKLSCTPTPDMLSKYEKLYRGDTSYLVHTTPTDGSGNYLSPVIDGTLEDNVWWYAETLIINSWEDAGAGAACGDPKAFKGPQSLHSLWRFCYNQDGLYVGIEIHDDIHDIDNDGDWLSQDAVQFTLDPWDWGDKAAGLWSKGTNTFRRYFSNQLTVMPNGGSEKAYLMLVKRIYGDGYIQGLVNSVFKRNSDKGMEATNFANGENGIQFAAKAQGFDAWGRSIWHMEFKFPFHQSNMWKILDDKGTYFGPDRLPKQGNLFKMDFYDLDDDIVGPNGNKGGRSGLMRRRDNSTFCEDNNHQNWSDTKYHMTFKFGGAAKQVARPDASNISHGDPRIAGSWVDAATEQSLYQFSGDGIAAIDDAKYFYDSTTTAGGTISLKSDLTGSYVFKKHASGNVFKDSLTVTISGKGTYSLLRLVPYGNPNVIGRWVKSTLVDSSTSRCGTLGKIWRPLSSGIECRFTPLTQIKKSQSAFANCQDSLRIYSFANDSFVGHVAFTNDKLIVGRDSVYATYELKTIEKTTSLIVSYTQSSLGKDTLIPWGMYNVMSFGETGGNGTYNKLFSLFSAMSQADQVTSNFWRIKVIDKYKSPADVRLYPSPVTRSLSYPVSLYPDMVMNMDTLSPKFWTREFKASFSLDSTELTGYNATTGTATGSQKKAADSVFANNAWVEQTCRLMVYGPVKTDTLIVDTTSRALFKDTTQVTWFTGTEGAPANSIYPWCIGIEDEPVVATVKTEEVENYPNPFNPSTTIRFAIPSQRIEQHFSLALYNVRGQLVRTLAKGVAGSFGLQRKVVWDGTDNMGHLAGAGVYVYRLTVGAKVKQGKMVFVK